MAAVSPYPTLVDVDNIVHSIINVTGGNGVEVASKSGFLSGLLGSGSLGIWIILGVIVLAVVILYTVRRFSPLTPFIYANARIHARINFMVSDAKFEELADATSMNQLMNSLKDYEVGNDLEAVGSTDDVKKVHSALEASFNRSLKELYELSPKNLRPLLNAYTMITESKMLRVIYRARRGGVPVDETLLYPIGNVDENVLRHLKETQSVADMGVVLADTVYSGLFDKQFETLEEFETALDQLILDHFVAVVKKVKMYDGPYIIDMMNQRMGILNILALMRMRMRDVPEERQAELLITTNTSFDENVPDLIKSKDMESFVKATKRLPYHDAMLKAYDLYKKDDQMVHFERELWLYYKDYVVKQDLGHTLGPYPLFSYLIKKEFELKNLFAVSTGIDVKMAPARIRGLII